MRRDVLGYLLFWVAAPLGFPEMIVRVLNEDYLEGAGPNQVLKKIRDRFDPNVDPNNVRPTMWRMEKDGRLQKFEDKYRLPQKNEAAGPPHEDAPTASAQEHSKDEVLG